MNTLSSGESEILTLGLDLLTICVLWELDNQENRVLLIDEPDTHLHPDLQQHLARFLARLVDQFKVQIIVATHSTTLLSALGYHGKGKTSVIYLTNTVDEQRAIKFDDVLQELSTCLGGHALMGPLFAAPLLLVEGDDEYKIWGQVPRYNKVNIAVIPCEGSSEVKRFQKALEKVFASLQAPEASPLGFALLDHDVPLPKEDPNNPQQHVKYLSLGCKESENLYLADEVLKEMGTDWESAKEKIKAESPNWGEKRIILDQCDTWDRKTADLKEVVDVLQSIIDPKKLPWTLRLAKCIGGQRPEGQLAEFLSKPVVESLWGKTDQVATGEAQTAVASDSV